MNWTATGAIGLALAVILGAFGAHGLRTRLDAYSMSVYERAVFYHFIHAMGLLVVSILPRVGIVSLTAGLWVCALLLTGEVIFSGSLYLLAVTGIRGLGPSLLLAAYRSSPPGSYSRLPCCSRPNQNSLRSKPPLRLLRLGA
jgi:uncharacterized membrane protein YgdD (TMEM256/DUF423 family)